MNDTTSRSHRPSRLLTARRAVLPWILWVFGLATTLLLIGLWGRAVTTDDGAIARSAEAALSADLVTDRVYDWIGDGITSATGATPVETAAVISAVREHAVATAAVEALLDDVVDALVAPPGEAATVDVTRALAPLVPEVVAELAAQGVDVPVGQVEAAVADLDPVMLDTGEAVSVGVVTEQAGSLLTRGVVAAALMLAVAGFAAVALSEERWQMVRSLATRISFSALSFAALLRISGWALDPDGGRSPLRRSGAILVGSNLHVLLIAAAIAAGVALTIWVARRPTRATRSGAGRSEADSHSQSDTTTQELVPV